LAGATDRAGTAAGQLPHPTLTLANATYWMPSPPDSATRPSHGDWTSAPARSRFTVRTSCAAPAPVMLNCCTPALHRRTRRRQLSISVQEGGQLRPPGIAQRCYVRKRTDRAFEVGPHRRTRSFAAIPTWPRFPTGPAEDVPPPAHPIRCEARCSARAMDSGSGRTPAAPRSRRCLRSPALDSDQRLGDRPAKRVAGAGQNEDVGRKFPGRDLHRRAKS
jgi:hypothetical protein